MNIKWKKFLPLKKPVFESPGPLFLQVSYTKISSFHAVAFAGGFTAASKILHVGQPTITAQVQALDDFFGVELFHRRGRHVELTNTGRELYAVTKRMEILEKEAQDVLQTAGGFQSGNLKIVAVGPYHLTEMLTVFHERFPYLNITVTVRNSEEILDNLLNFEVDVAVLSQTEDDSRILVVAFCQESLVVLSIPRIPGRRGSLSGLKSWKVRTSFCVNLVLQHAVLLKKL